MVAENAAAGAYVGDPVMAMDENEGDTLTYALGGGDAASFTIDPATGQIMVGEGTELDFESEMTTYTVTVTATDSFGESDMATVTINVTDVNEQPMFAEDTAMRSVAENTAAGMNVGDPVMAMDEDEGDTLTYALGGDDAASFDIDSSSGQLMTSAALDYETKATYTVTVTATDGDGLDDMITVTINVTDVEEALCVTEGAVASDAGDGLKADCQTLLDSEDALGGSLNWDAGTDIMDWDGVTVDGGRVTNIYLKDMGLDGMIPASLGRLDALERLQLHDNDLGGPTYRTSWATWTTWSG